MFRIKVNSQYGYIKLRECKFHDTARFRHVSDQVGNGDQGKIQRHAPFPTLSFPTLRHPLPMRSETGLHDTGVLDIYNVNCFEKKRNAFRKRNRFAIKLNRCRIKLKNEIGVQ